MYMFSLTNLTGARKNAGRTMVLATFEISRRSFIVTVLALAVAIVPTGILAPIGFAFGMVYGVAVIVIIPTIVVLATFFFVEGRTREGLGLRRYEAMLDKKRARNGIVFVCHEQLHDTYLAEVRPLDRDLSAILDHEADAPVLSLPKARRKKESTDMGGWLE